MFKRVMIYFIGVCILAFGIVLNTKTQLGVSSIASVPYVLSELTWLTLGQTTLLVYALYILGQFILMKKVTLKVLLQLPFSFVFGLLVDFFDTILNFIPSNMLLSFMCLLSAIVITAFGAYLVVSMNYIVNPADGIVQTLAQVLKSSFGRIKVIFDCSMVSLSLLLALVFSHQLIGFGVGTIVSAVSIGKIISLFSKYLDERILRIMNSDEKSK